MSPQKVTTLAQNKASYTQPKLFLCPVLKNKATK
jgi:hypothetical protein